MDYTSRIRQKSEAFGVFSVTDNTLCADGFQKRPRFFGIFDTARDAHHAVKQAVCRARIRPELRERARKAVSICRG